MVMIFPREAQAYRQMRKSYFVLSLLHFPCPCYNKPMLHLHDDKLRKLEELANALRHDIIKMLVKAGSGHSAGPLGLADIFSALYFHILNHRPSEPNWQGRDRLFVSNGHVCPVMYAALAHSGYFPKSELMTLRRLGSRLQGHPERGALPGIENTSGPLGNGSAQAAGAAYALRLKKSPAHVYCILSDGELEEGITWETALFAHRNALSNMTWIIDRNNIQIDGNTENIMPLEPLREKFESFGFHTQEVDGHNIRDFVDAVGQAQAVVEKPSVIIAHTIPGKGVPFMEYDYTWHGKPPNQKEAARALHDLRTLRGKIVSEHE